jgi:enoyl-[acyl-carrier protein] reductase I
VTIDNVGNTAVYLASDMSLGMTGEVLFNDCGYNIMGL